MSDRDYLLHAPGITLPIPSIAHIQQDVCMKYGITLAELLSQQRSRRVAWPRQEAMYRASKETLASLPMIGRAFNRDHTTCIHGIRKHAERLSIFERDGWPEPSTTMEQVLKRRIPQVIALSTDRTATNSEFVSV